MTLSGQEHEYRNLQFHIDGENGKHIYMIIDGENAGQNVHIMFDLTPKSVIIWLLFIN